jgi:hypothetical protein
MRQGRGSRRRARFTVLTQERKDGEARNVEVKFTGPDDVTIDPSEHGWLGAK